MKALSPYISRIERFTDQSLEVSPYMVNALLREAGITAVSLSRVLAVSPQHLRNVIHRRRRNPRIERAIARAIGKKVADVFQRKA